VDGKRGPKQAVANLLEKRFAHILSQTALTPLHGIEELIDLKQIRGRIVNRGCVTNKGMVARLQNDRIVGEFRRGPQHDRHYFPSITDWIGEYEVEMESLDPRGSVKDGSTRAENIHAP